MDKKYLINVEIAATIEVEAPSEKEALAKAYKMSDTDLEYSIVCVLPLSCEYGREEFNEENIPIWEDKDDEE